MIEELRKAGHTVVVADKETDYSGIDCFINGQAVDLKAQTTNGDYDTVLLSLRHTDCYGNWILPGYLRSKNIQVWFNSPEAFYILEDPHTVEQIATRFIFKSGDTDMFGNDHMLAVIPKSKLTKKYKRRIISK